MAHGGFRPGAGSKKGQKKQKTLDKEAFKKAMDEVFMEIARERFRPLVEAQFTLGTGYALIDKSDETGNKVFEQKPDPSAGKYLTEQVRGKPIQPIEGTGVDGAITVVIKKFDAN